MKLSQKNTVDLSSNIRFTYYEKLVRLNFFVYFLFELQVEAKLLKNNRITAIISFKSIKHAMMTILVENKSQFSLSFGVMYFPFIFINGIITA